MSKNMIFRLIAALILLFCCVYALEEPRTISTFAILNCIPTNHLPKKHRITVGQINKVNFGVSNLGGEFASSFDIVSSSVIYGAGAKFAGKNIYSTVLGNGTSSSLSLIDLDEHEILKNFSLPFSIENVISIECDQDMLYFVGQNASTNSLFAANMTERIIRQVDSVVIVVTFPSKYRIGYSSAFCNQTYFTVVYNETGEYLGKMEIESNTLSIEPINSTIEWMTCSSIGELYVLTSIWDISASKLRRYFARISTSNLQTSRELLVEFPSDLAIEPSLMNFDIGNNTIVFPFMGTFDSYHMADTDAATGETHRSPPISQDTIIADLFLIPAPVTTSILPQYGPLEGSTTVTIKGTNFVKSSFLKCKFIFPSGSATSVAAVYVSSNEIQCNSLPSAIEQSIFVEMSNDKETVTSNYLSFEYYTPPNVEKIEPTECSTRGGCNITVAGTGFENLPGVSCKFGEYVVTGYYHSPTEIICISPVTTNAFLTTLEVSLNNQQYTNDAIPFTFTEQFSEMCRSANELSISVDVRLRRGALFYRNIASEGVISFATFREGFLNDYTATKAELTDGDRCCKYTELTEGVKCGLVWKQNDTSLSFVQIDLGRLAYVNEFISSWFDTCRNLPRNEYTLSYYSNSTGTMAWDVIQEHDLKVDPCYSIPGDGGQVALCVDVIQPLIAQRIRLSFNNSAGEMGVAGGTMLQGPTDGGWIYEFEVHGKFLDIPTQLWSEGIIFAQSFESTAAVSLPPIQIGVANIMNTKLNITDAAITSGVKNQTVIKPLFIRVDPSNIKTFIADVTTQLQASDVILTEYLNNLTTIKLLSPSTGTYNLSFRAVEFNEFLIPANITFKIEEGPAASLQSIPSEGSVNSAVLTSVTSIQIRAMDAGNNFCGSKAPIFNVTASLAQGPDLECLQGSLHVTGIDGLAVFSNLYLSTPKIGKYVIVFNSSSLITSNITITVTVGLPYQLKIYPNDYAAGPFPSLITTRITASEPIKVTILDGGFNPVNSNCTVSVCLLAINDTGVSLSPPGIPFDSILNGTTSVVAQGTVASFVLVDFLRPVVGNYRLQFNSDGLLGTEIVVNVSIGEVYQLFVEVSGKETYQSRVQEKLDCILISALDAAGQTVTSESGKIVTVQQIQPFSPSVLNGNVTVVLTNGVANFTQLSFASAPADRYCLRFTLEGAQAKSVELWVNVTVGPSTRIIVTSDTQINLPAVYRTHFPVITVIAQDAGGNTVGNTDGVERDVTASIYGSGSNLLSGTIQCTMFNGSVNFTALSMIAPPAQSYVLQFSTSGIDGVNMTVTINIGPAARLVVLSPLSIVKESVSSVALPVVTVIAQDAGGNTVGNTDGVERDVTASGSALLDGQTTSTMANGSVSFSSLLFKSPPSGIYALRFDSDGLENVNLTINITIGPAHHLNIKSYHSGPYLSSSMTYVQPVVIEALDAGGSFVGGTDITIRSVSAVLAQQAAAGPGRDAVLGGTTDGSMISGTANITNLTMKTPRCGEYVISFSSNNLIGVNATVIISEGIATQLEIAAFSQSEYVSITDTNLAALAVRTLDAGFNRLSSADSRGLEVSANASGVLKGSVTATMYNFTHSFSDLYLLSPPVGIYRLTVASSGIASAYEDVKVSIGPAVRLVVQSPLSIVKESVSSVALPVITVIAQDAGGNTVGNTDGVERDVTASIYGSGSNLLDGQTVSKMVNGSVSFLSLSMIAPPVQNYALQFSTSGIDAANMTVTINIGPAARLVVLSPLSIVKESVSSVALPVVTVIAQDAGGNTVGNTDGVERDVTASGSALLDGQTTSTMANGSVSFSSLLFKSPPSGIYYVEFGSSGLLSTNLTVNITVGPPHHLSTLNSSFVAESAQTVLLEMIYIMASDAGGNFVALSSSQPNISVMLSKSSASILEGLTTTVMTNGVIKWTRITLTAPVATEYCLKFYPVELSWENTTVCGTVNVGKPAALYVAQSTQSLKCLANTLLSKIEIGILDAGGNHVGSLHSSSWDGKSVVATLLNNTGITGNLSSPIINGSVTLQNIVLKSPGKGVYFISLSDSSSAWTSALVLIEIGVGRLSSAKIISAPVGPYMSQAITTINDTVLHLLDAGKNEISQVGTDGDGAYFIMSIFKGTRQIGNSIYHYLSAESDGIVKFSAISLHKPTTGIYTIKITGIGLYTGSCTLESNFTVASGTQSFFSASMETTSFVADARVELSNITINTFDIAGNLVRDENAVFHTAVIGIRSPFGTRLNGTTTVSFSSSQREIASKNLWIEYPKTSTEYILEVNITGLLTLQQESESYRIPFSITSGPAVSLSIYGVETFDTTGDDPLSPAPSVRALDIAGNTVSETVSIRPVNLYGPQKVEMTENFAGLSAHNTINGIVQFQDIRVSGYKGKEYVLAFCIEEKRYINATVLVKMRECGLIKKASTPLEPKGFECRCPAGYFLEVNGDVEECKQCPRATYKIEHADTTACYPCKMNEDTSSTASESKSDCHCRDGTYLLNDDCVDCKQGAECKGGSIVPAKGSWSASIIDSQAGVDAIISCPNPNACIGGSNATCEAGYEGPLCAVCSPNYGGSGVQCSECASASVNWTIIVAIIFGLVAFVAILISRNRAGEKGSAAQLLKILINYVQVIAFVGGLSVRWGQFLTENLFDVAETMNAGVPSGPLDCLFNRPSYYEHFWIYTLLPVLCVFVPLVYYSCRINVVVAWLAKFVKRKKNPEPETPRSDGHVRLRRSHSSTALIKQAEGIRDKIVVSTILIIVLVHPTVTRNVLEVFVCQKVSDTMYFLEADYSVQCYTTLHWQYMIGAGIYLVVFSIGFFVLLFWLMFRDRYNRSRIISKMENTTDPIDYGELSAVDQILYRRFVKYRCLYNGYKPERYYWDIAIMVRKTLIAAIMVFARGTPLVQIYLAIWIIVASLAIHLHSKPYDENQWKSAGIHKPLMPLSNVETLSISMTFFTLMMGMLYYTQDLISVDMHSWLDVLLILANTITILIFVTLFITAASKKFTGQIVKKYRGMRDGSFSIGRLSSMSLSRRKSKQEVELKVIKPLEGEVESGESAPPSELHGKSVKFDQSEAEKGEEGKEEAPKKILKPRRLAPLTGASEIRSETPPKGPLNGNNLTNILESGSPRHSSVGPTSDDTIIAMASITDDSTSSDSKRDSSPLPGQIDSLDYTIECDEFEHL